MALLLAVLPFMPSCGQFEIIVGPEPDIELKLEVPNAGLGKAAGSQFAYVSANADWEITVDYQGDAQGWISLSPSSGTSCEGQGILFKWDANTAEDLRTARLVLICDGAEAAVTVNQAGTSGNTGGGSGSEIKSDPVPGWLELPATDDENLYFITHDMKVGTYSGRSYSIYYDADNLVSRWVAYPLNRGLIGAGSGRTDAWGLDPNLPQGQQPVLYGSWGVGWLDRGHQIPSADRLRDGDNQQTFYGTNMTPQIGKNFNQGIWAKLEGKVRSWSDKYDTLYVVTGCVVKQNSTQGKYNQVGGYVFDNDRKRVAVPTAYYKAVLGYKASSSTYGYGGYCGAAIYYDHEDIYDTGIYASDLISIRELEEKLGYKLFVNLSKKISEEQVEKVKTQDPSKVAVWK